MGSRLCSAIFAEIRLASSSNRRSLCSAAAVVRAATRGDTPAIKINCLLFLCRKIIPDAHSLNEYLHPLGHSFSLICGAGSRSRLESEAHGSVPRLPSEGLVRVVHREDSRRAVC